MSMDRFAGPHLLRPLLFKGPKVTNPIKKKRAIIYVDGFNLYYGCLKGSKYKWLDLGKLSKSLLDESNYDIVKIKYFTARIIDEDGTGTATRQGYYLKALGSIQNLEIYYGKFKKREKSVKVIPPLKVVIENPMTRAQDVREKTIIKGISYEEKGTDVNLASHLMIDLYENAYDVAMVISNDSDYLFSFSHVREKGKGLFIINTKLGSLPQHELKHLSLGSKKLTEEKLKNSQFSETVNDVRIPKQWE